MLLPDLDWACGTIAQPPLTLVVQPQLCALSPGEKHCPMKNRCLSPCTPLTPHPQACATMPASRTACSCYPGSGSSDVNKGTRHWVLLTKDPVIGSSHLMEVLHLGPLPTPSLQTNKAYRKITCLGKCKLSPHICVCEKFLMLQSAHSISLF